MVCNIRRQIRWTSEMTDEQKLNTDKGDKHEQSND